MIDRTSLIILGMPRAVIIEHNYKRKELFRLVGGSAASLIQIRRFWPYNLLVNDFFLLQNVMTRICSVDSFMILLLL